MARILKYLKPYTGLILIAVALLFVQANADSPCPTTCRKSSTTAFSRAA